MTSPLVGVKGQSACNVSVMASSASAESVCNSLGLKEHNYLGLSDCSSVDSSVASNVPNENKNNLTLKATELRLGLPGSQSPERESDFAPRRSVELDEKQLFTLVSSKDGISSSLQKTVVAGNKRGFSDTVSGLSNFKTTVCNEGNWIFKAESSDSGQPKLAGSMQSNNPSGTHSAGKTDISVKPSQICEGKSGSNTNNAPAAKIQAVGWPPIRSFRKNALSTPPKKNEVDAKPSSGALLVKVSMEGAPYLRKVDLNACSTYQELSSSLGNMFGCSTIGCGPEGAPCKDVLNDGKLKDLLNGSEYVLTYEDKDGDWMLVGDVPWEMFIGSCKRLKIMKGSDAIGLAPRAVDKSKNRS